MSRIETLESEIGAIQAELTKWIKQQPQRTFIKNQLDELHLKRVRRSAPESRKRFAGGTQMSDTQVMLNPDNLQET